MREKRSFHHQLCLCIFWLLTAYLAGHFIGNHLIPDKGKVAITGVFLRIVGGFK